MEVLDLLERLAREHFVWMEVGVQTVHDPTLRAVNRCHTTAESLAAIEALLARNLAVSAHVMLGLPGESFEHMMETAEVLSEIGLHGIKLHNLHVIEGTAMAAQYRQGQLALLSLSEYAAAVVAFLERLPPTVILHRLTAESPRRLTVAPEWAAGRWRTHNAVHRALDEADSWQGKALGFGREALEWDVALPGLQEVQELSGALREHASD
jgi:radical SAM protein (TIGR01212 family)